MHKNFNHHHEITDEQQFVDFGTGEFIADNKLIPLLKALNEIGLTTRTHNYSKEGSFIGIIIDDVELSIRNVNERDSSRTTFNGKKELLIQWNNKEL